MAKMLVVIESVVCQLYVTEIQKIKEKNCNCWRKKLRTEVIVICIRVLR